MSENIPESVPTSMDPRSRRPAKKRAISPSSAQAAQVATLMKHPEKHLNVDKSRDRRMAPPPEIVANVQGSSAGAGSGEFHVYKASRRREYERLRNMDDQIRKEKETENFKQNTEETRKKDEEKTAKKREKRNKKKQNAANKAKEARKVAKDDNEDGEDIVDFIKPKIVPRKIEKKENSGTSATAASEPVAEIIHNGGGIVDDDD